MLFPGGRRDWKRLFHKTVLPKERQLALLVGCLPLAVILSSWISLGELVPLRNCQTDFLAALMTPRTRDLTWDMLDWTSSFQHTDDPESRRLRLCFWSQSSFLDFGIKLLKTLRKLCVFRYLCSCQSEY